MDNKEKKRLLEIIIKEHDAFVQRIEAIKDSLKSLRNSIEEDQIKFDNEIKSLNERIKKSLSDDSSTNKEE